MSHLVTKLSKPLESDVRMLGYETAKSAYSMKNKILAFASYFIFFFAFAAAMGGGGVLGALGVALLGCVLNPRLSEFIKEKLPSSVNNIQFYSGSVVLAFFLIGASGSDNSSAPASREEVAVSEGPQVESVVQPQAQSEPEEPASDARSRVYGFLTEYPAVGSAFDESTSPCWEKGSPEANNPLNPGFYCRRQEFNSFDTSLSDDFENENPQLEDPKVFQSFKYREDGTLNSMLYGMYNAFENAEDAVEFLNDTYGDLGLRHDDFNEDVYNEGISLKIDFSFSDPVLEWNRRQMSFGCDAYPGLTNGSSNWGFNDPRQKEWEGMFYEVVGHYELSDVELVKFTDFQINRNSVDSSGETRCVIATLLYGERKVTTLGADPRSVIELVVAEIDPSFSLTFDRN